MGEMQWEDVRSMGVHQVFVRDAEGEIIAFTSFHSFSYFFYGLCMVRSDRLEVKDIVVITRTSLHSRGGIWKSLAERMFGHLFLVAEWGVLRVYACARDGRGVERIKPVVLDFLASVDHPFRNFVPPP